MKSPLVTVSIPTRNSANTLEYCLKSVRSQTYKNIEINIIDASSIDKTSQIAKKYKVRDFRIQTEGGLLSARNTGVQIARGKYVLILDSDQILKPDAVSRCVNLIETKKIDMVALEEGVYKNDNFIEKLFEMDRKLIEKVKDMSPFTGVILPRFYKTTLLKKALGKIPSKILDTLGGTDHAIIYYECWKISHKVLEIPNAVVHMEPNSLFQICKKFYRWGYTSVDARYGKYRKLMNKKERLRTGLFRNGLIIESMGSIILILLKYIPFKVGYFKGVIEKR